MRHSKELTWHTLYIYIIIIIGFSKEGNAIAIITCDSHEAAHQKLRHDILIEPKKHYDDAVGNNDMDNEHGSEWIGKCNESLVDVQAERTITRNFSRILEVARQLVDKCGWYGHKNVLVFLIYWFSHVEHHILTSEFTPKLKSTVLNWKLLILW